MKVLVTGATGFIGNYVVLTLLKQNHEVIATSTSIEKAKQYDWFSQVDYIPFNFEAVNNDVDYFTFFGSPDVLIHTAWEGLPNYKAAFHLEVNLARHILFLENMVENGLKSLSVTGTCFEYGLQEGCLTENTPAAPSTVYAEAKNALRQALQKLPQQFSFKWIRLFYMYGNGQSPKSLLSQLDKALENGDSSFNMSGGEQIRDYLPIEKVADYVVKIALQTKIDGIVHCCSGEPISVKKLVENYLEEKQKSIELNLGFYPYADYEPMAFWGNTEKLDKILQ